MLRKDRFLLAILVGLAALAVAAVWVVLAGTPEAAYVDEALPDGVVRNYVLALQRGDIDRAYGYLADRSWKPTRSEFRSSYAVTGVATSRTALEVGDAILDGDEATVDLSVSTSYGGIFLFDTSYNYQASARLIRQDGEWRLLEMPSEWWDYSWYMDGTSPYPGDMMP